MNLTQQAVALLPPRLRRAVEKSGIHCELWEIRLRLLRPISLTKGGENLCIDEEGRRCPPHRGICATQEELQWVLERATASSLYQHHPSLRRGYVTTARGIRVGICGRGLYGEEAASPSQVIQISSLNIRIPCFAPDAARDALEFFRKLPLASTLFFAPPGGGKTTFIRSLALRCSMGDLGKPLRVAAVDEREELFGAETENGAGLLDVLRGYSKEDALECALRVMNPQILVCDELGTPADCRAVERLSTGGVVFFATAHASSPEELLRRGELGGLIRKGYFPYLCRLALGASGIRADFFRFEELVS